MLIPPPFNLLPRLQPAIEYLCGINQMDEEKEPRGRVEKDRRMDGRWTNDGRTDITGQTTDIGQHTDLRESEELWDEEKYKNLQRQLHKRYLNGRKGAHKSVTSSEILEHTLEILHDTNTIVNMGKEARNLQAAAVVAEKIPTARFKWLLFFLQYVIQYFLSKDSIFGASSAV